MGEVWLARDSRVDREIAIKVMRTEYARDDQAIARFLREARVQGRLEHPAIVPLHDLRTDDPPYIVMKRLAGTTLAHVLAEIARGDTSARSRWPRRALLARLVDACLAIELAHSRGVVHRDLKPGNIMLGDFGETYVLDWGLARVTEAAEPDATRQGIPLATEPLHTVEGAVLGTPGYMPPEQIRGEPVDHRADVFALGCILYEILVDAPAIPRDRAFEATLEAASHRPSRAGGGVLDIPPELDDTCARATAADPEARLSSARALADGIQRYLDGDRDLEQRRTLAAEHAQRSVEKFAELGDAGRADAMREAGRALVLDPTNTDAQRVLARMLLEPPREVPLEARRAIEDERQLEMRAILRKGALAYAGNLAFAPIAFALGVTGWPLALVSALLLVLVALCTTVARLPTPPTTFHLAIAIGVHLVMLACMGLFFGSLLFVPMLALVSLPAMIVFPSLSSPRLVLALHLLAVATPIALELLRVARPTFWFDHAALVIEPWAVRSSPAVLVGVYLAIVAVQLLITTIVFSVQRSAQERAREKIHVHSWHLAQLVR